MEVLTLMTTVIIYAGFLLSTNHGYEPQSKLWGIVPSASRDCSTYQLQYASLSELEFHNNCSIRRRSILPVAVLAMEETILTRRGTA
jgi:hypothetical protein